MEFFRYLSLKRYGNVEVENINIGTVHVFPKLDGTNASVWIEGEELKAGSRNRELSLDNDNAGFLANLRSSAKSGIHSLLLYNSHLRLFGEWLVPHTVKDYSDSSWRKFYVFDVYDEQDERYLTYDEYKPLMDEYEIDYIPCQKVIINGDYDDFVFQAQLADYCMPAGKAGEGVVLKNYEYINKYGSYAAAKVVNSEFKADHRKSMGSPVQENRMTEQELADRFPPELAEKTLAKISLEEGGWRSQFIPRLLEQTYYDFFHEELWTAIKKTKAKSIDLTALRSFINQKIKEALPQIF